MELVYKNTGKEVKIGDLIKDTQGEKCIVKFFKEPYSPESEGFVNLQYDGSRFCKEVFVSVIGAKWINREEEKEDMEVVRKLIDAAAEYALAYSWNDSDLIDMLVLCGITHDDFIKLGKGEFVEEYFNNK